LSFWLYQETANASELVILLRQNNYLKLFIHNIRDSEGVNVVRVIIRQSGLGWNSFFDRIEGLGIVIGFTLGVVISRHRALLPISRKSMP